MPYNDDIFLVVMYEKRALLGLRGRLLGLVDYVGIKSGKGFRRVWEHVKVRHRLTLKEAAGFQLCKGSSQ